MQKVFKKRDIRYLYINKAISEMKDKVIFDKILETGIFW